MAQSTQVLTEIRQRYRIVSAVVQLSIATICSHDLVQRATRSCRIFCRVLCHNNPYYTHSLGRSFVSVSVCCLRAHSGYSVCLSGPHRWKRASFTWWVCSCTDPDRILPLWEHQLGFIDRLGGWVRTKWLVLGLEETIKADGEYHMNASSHVFRFLGFGVILVEVRHVAVTVRLKAMVEAFFSTARP